MSTWTTPCKVRSGQLVVPRYLVRGSLLRAPVVKVQGFGWSVWVKSGASSTGAAGSISVQIPPYNRVLESSTTGDFNRCLDVRLPSPLGT